jgi:hypothetical protein
MEQQTGVAAHDERPNAASVSGFWYIPLIRERRWLDSITLHLTDLNQYDILNNQKGWFK